MSPKELRAFRETLGLSRREFAPKLFISEPTLERWERGQGGPGKVQLQILRRMREHLQAGHSLAYFEYDAGADVSTAKPPYEEGRMIIETLQGLGGLVLDKEKSDNGEDWSVRIGLGWNTAEPTDLNLICNGSERLDRPVIDFTLEIRMQDGNIEGLSEKLASVCFRHGVSWGVKSLQDNQFLLSLRQRIFTTGCNPDTVRHVIGNFRSCWERLKWKCRPTENESPSKRCVKVEPAIESRAAT